MKSKTWAAFLTGCVLLFSCSKDELVTPGSSSGSVNAGDDTAGSGIKTDSSDDDIANTTFDLTVKVVFSSGGATVTGASSDLTVKTDGNDVTITNNGDAVVRYELSGSTSDGFFKLYSGKKQAIVLSGVSITNPAGAAINNQSHKRTFVVVEGTNALADGATYSDETSDEDMKAAFFSEGQLVFSGSGSLTVTAKGKAGITSDDYVRFLGGQTVKVTSSAGHGIRGKQAVIVSDGTLDVNLSAAATGKKGFTSDTLVYIGGGVTTITSAAPAGTVDGELTGAAGIKADQRFEMVDGTLTVTCSGTGAKGISGDNVAYFKGGTVTVSATGSNYGSSGSSGGRGRDPWGGGSSSSDNSKSAKGVKFDGNIYVSGGSLSVRSNSHEGIEAKGVIEVSGGTVYSYASDDAINSAGNMTVSGGDVCGYSTGNDGLDANGNMYIRGGVVYAVGSGSPEVGLDANTEGGYKLYIEGGTLVAFSGIESGSSISQACLSTNWSKDVQYALYDGDDLLMTFRAPSSGGTGMVLSHGALKSGSSYSLKSGVTVSGGTAYFGGLYTEGATASGGTSTSLTATTSVSGNGPGGGGPGGGGWGGR